MSEIRLRDKEIYPSAEVLKAILGGSFAAYEEMIAELAELDITPEWNYYRDGNAWLGKMPFKKKNLGWFHVYEGYFMVTFYFTEKHLEKIAELDISEEIKKAFFMTKPTGKLIAMFITMDTGKLPDDFMKVLLFKKNLK